MRARDRDFKHPVYCLSARTFFEVVQMVKICFSYPFRCAPLGGSVVLGILVSLRRGRDLRSIHPHLIGKSPEDLKYQLPLFTHCDAGPASKNLSAFTLNWFCPLGVGSELETHFVTAVWLKGKHDNLPERVWAETWRSFCCLSAKRVAAGFEGAGDWLAQEIQGIEWGGDLDGPDKGRGMV